MWLRKVYGQLNYSTASFGGMDRLTTNWWDTPEKTKFYHTKKKKTEGEVMLCYASKQRSQAHQQYDGRLCKHERTVTKTCTRHSRESKCARAQARSNLIRALQQEYYLTELMQFHKEKKLSRSPYDACSRSWTSIKSWESAVICKTTSWQKVKSI